MVQTEAAAYRGAVPAASDDRESTAGRRVQPRGARRREALIEAGTELLVERGWAALTSRAVAERASAPPGLVHYHFGDLPTLRREIAATAVAGAFEPALAALLDAPTWPAGVAAVIRANQARAPEQARMSGELIAVSLHDADVAALLREALADARTRLTPWLEALGTEEPEGTATVIIALLDGLLLHSLIDPALPLHAVATAMDP